MFNPQKPITMATTPKKVKGTQTEKNLMAAYFAESTAYTRYMFYAKQADKENYFPIGQIFRETAENEMTHGKVFFKFLEGGKCMVELDGDAGVIGDTATNLEIAISEELNEGTEFYLAAAKTADEEGFSDIADHFRAIADVETHHRMRFEHYLAQVKAGTVWKRDTPIKWQCLVCGYIYEGTEPPTTCPGCDHPYQHYMALDYQL